MYPPATKWTSCCTVGHCRMRSRNPKKSSDHTRCHSYRTGGEVSEHLTEQLPAMYDSTRLVHSAFRLDSSLRRREWRVPRNAKLLIGRESSKSPEQAWLSNISARKKGPGYIQETPRDPRCVASLQRLHHQSKSAAQLRTSGRA